MKMKGFTIIELMIVLAIIGIFAVLVYPAYQDYAYIHDKDHPERLEKYNKYQDQLQEERMERRYYGRNKHKD